MMNPHDADLRSQTYRERLRVDFTTQINSITGGYPSNQIEALVASLVDSAMGPIDALIDEQTGPDIEKMLAAINVEAQANS
jgi:hypothetical protein